MKITSCGIIKNEDKPRVGVISANSEKLSDWIYEEITQGIDIHFEQYINELQNEGKTEDEIEKLTEFWENDSSTILIGDWIKDTKGNYSPDKSKDFAASYHEGIICVEWSKKTKPCHHTSPCYVMANGDGPCGDLETEGNSVIAYDLPEDLYSKEEK